MCGLTIFTKERVWSSYFLWNKKYIEMEICFTKTRIFHLASIFWMDDTSEIPSLWNSLMSTWFGQNGPELLLWSVWVQEVNIISLCQHWILPLYDIFSIDYPIEWIYWIYSKECRECWKTEKESCKRMAFRPSLQNSQMHAPIPMVYYNIIYVISQAWQDLHTVWTPAVHRHYCCLKMITFYYN